MNLFNSLFSSQTTTKQYNKNKYQISVQAYNCYSENIMQALISIYYTYKCIYPYIPILQNCDNLTIASCSIKRVTK